MDQSPLPPLQPYEAAQFFQPEHHRPLKAFQLFPREWTHLMSCRFDSIDRQVLIAMSHGLAIPFDTTSSSAPNIRNSLSGANMETAPAGISCMNTVVGTNPPCSGTSCRSKMNPHGGTIATFSVTPSNGLNTPPMRPNENVGPRPSSRNESKFNEGEVMARHSSSQLKSPSPNTHEHTASQRNTPPMNQHWKSITASRNDELLNDVHPA